MTMPGRKFIQASSKYRYGFNGKEKLDEIKGDGNSYDYGARILDPRLGRWLSVDPLQQKYTDLSPYQYCANSPISAKDPDGRLIIFINGMWGGLFGIDEPKENYWGSSWVSAVQNRIEGSGSKAPRFYDGSIGGQSRIFAKPFQPSTASTKQNRINAGTAAGYADAAAILGGLDKGETIKIVTNSMGAAFERGFTKGILKYQTEENERRTTFNADIDKMLAPLQQQQEFLNEMSKSSNFMTADTKKKLAGDLSLVNSKINDLVAKKKDILNVKIEMVIDLSSHEIDYPDPNAVKSFFMMAAKLNNWEKGFVDERAIALPAQQIGIGADGKSQMSCHYGPCAPAAAMPESDTKPKPKTNK
jgi:RHS repeat-associated protein